MIPKGYLHKVYAGFLGMNAGIRLGAPLEPACWTERNIQASYGTLRGYVKEYKNFAADDDVNGPVYFIRSLTDDAKNRAVSPLDVARAWMNYTREGRGMFWWGGYGVSAEHTAYLNLKAGIQPPQSGSIALNGDRLPQQIGGQIFIDTWGLVLPADPSRAADFGQAAASVSHDGEGLWGARFFCAAIAHAFVCGEIDKVVREALCQVPQGSCYRAVAEAVIAFHRQNPHDFRACFHMLERDWGYDRYPGECPIIPNAGVCVLALLYGKGDFARSIEIAVMCGWDTDCNAGNVGSVLGVLNGIEGIPSQYRRPINDFIVLSGISGWLNMLDIPSYAKELASLGYALAGQALPKELSETDKKSLCFDFELPGSTHGMQAEPLAACRMTHSTEVTFSGSGSLKILVDGLPAGEGFRVFYQTYYRREDFDDERYDPAFTPKVYSGQRVSMHLFCSPLQQDTELTASPYVKCALDGEILSVQKRISLRRDAWTTLEFDIPPTGGDLVCEVGFLLENAHAAYGTSFSGCVYLDDFHVDGEARYSIDFSKQKMNFGNVSPFSVNPRNAGTYELAPGGMQASSCGVCDAYAGSYYAKDCELSVPITPIFGEGHMAAVRAQGAMRGYWAGFAEHGKLALFANDFGFSLLRETAFDWQPHKTYLLTITAVRDSITVRVDGEERIHFQDGRFAYGMVGCCRLSAGRCLYGNITVKELREDTSEGE